MEWVIEKISEWHKARLITVNGTSTAQMIKLMEETGELAAGIARGNKELIKDSIGDITIVLVAIAELEGFTLEECVKHSYEEIRNRTGHLNEDGIFIKTGDENNAN